MQPLRRSQLRHVPGEFYGTPKEVWGFSVRTERSPVAAAREFVRTNAELFGLDDPAGSLERRDLIQSLGATHVILQQVYRGVRVHRGFVTVHVGRGGRIYLAKNRAVPAQLLGASWASNAAGFPASRSCCRHCVCGS
jgi:hypothetical protein